MMTASSAFVQKQNNGSKHLSAKTECFTPGDSHGATTTQCYGNMSSTQEEEEKRNLTKKAVNAKHNTEQTMTSFSQFKPRQKIENRRPLEVGGN